MECKNYYDKIGKEPLVSVIVLTYKRFDNLKSNLLSVARQKYPNIELIIHDDGSGNFPTDRVSECLEQAKGLNKYSIYENPENKGTVKNYNLAIKRASGDIIIPLSQDDIFVDEYCVDRIVHHFLQTGDVLCTAKRRGKVSGVVYPSLTDIELLRNHDKRKLLLRTMYRNFISGAVLYIAKEAFVKDTSGIFDENYVLLEDWPFILNCIDSGIHVGFIEEVLIEFGESGVSHQKTPSLLFLYDIKYLYENLIIPKCKQNFGNETQLYIEYIYEKYIKMFCEYNMEVSPYNHLTTMQKFKLKYLLLRMTMYARFKGKDPVTDRIEYLLGLE